MAKKRQQRKTGKRPHQSQQARADREARQMRAQMERQARADTEARTAPPGAPGTEEVSIVMSGDDAAFEETGLKPGDVLTPEQAEAVSRGEPVQPRRIEDFPTEPVREAIRDSLSRTTPEAIQEQGGLYEGGRNPEVWDALEEVIKGAAGNADRTGASELCDLTDRRADRAAGGRDHHGLAGSHVRNGYRASPSGRNPARGEHDRLEWEVLVDLDRVPDIDTLAQRLEPLRATRH